VNTSKNAAQQFQTWIDLGKYVNNDNRSLWLHVADLPVQKPSGNSVGLVH